MFPSLLHPLPFPEAGTLSSVLGLGGAGGGGGRRGEMQKAQPVPCVAGMKGGGDSPDCPSRVPAALTVFVLDSVTEH